MKTRLARMPEDEGDRKYLLEMIMLNAYSGESLQMSLSRLAKTAAEDGYEVLRPSEVWGCYALHRELRERPYGK